ncbi:MAG TPA: methylated-DNA--[protein]-cysteine S-methyltransferase [Clostridiales bacterium]|jgi:methylated-DNA-[protein]-cysteine S-methyltransferase|nr:methylated-DNA--[protein]-cysteine S-methyltransferase [Clostridiales bacterium]
MQKSLLFIDTPAGRLGMVEEDEAITQVFFENEGVLLDARLEETKLLKKAGQQLQEYFAGRREIFDLPLAPKGTTFQLEVWRALQNIPYGETRSYKDIAAAVGNYKASRAVGMANHHNPIAIIIPCHRVIGSNGRLVGYGGGLDVKDYLLNLEKQYVLMKKNPN